MNNETIIKKVKYLMEMKGTLKYKLGEVLGVSPKASRQYKSVKASKFLNRQQKNISLEQLGSLANFFDKPVSYFLDEKMEIPIAHERKDDYRNMTPERIDSMKEGELNEAIGDIEKNNPEILKDTPLNTLSPAAKQAILKAYYRI